MCGRYFFDLESELLQNYYREAQTKQPKQAAELAAGEVFPSNLVVTLRKEEENILTPEIMKWGFTGFKKGQLMINARAETVEEKKTFHQPFLQNRCVFPMSGMKKKTNLCF
ncbi:TPA: SOS response-associated peptidase, partial [Enterococcus faecium]|nr:SOS response-associated peptidase [Enterococcus faecium]